MMATILVSKHAMPGATPPELLAAARRSLAEDNPAADHLAALRAAAALLAARAEVQPRARITSVWVLLVMAAPEFAEWAEYFAARPAGDGVRANAARFVELIEAALVPAEARLMGEGDN